MTAGGRDPRTGPVDAEVGRVAGLLAQALGGLQFGEILLTVHDGRVVQVTRVEKLRLDQPLRGDTPPRR